MRIMIRHFYISILFISVILGGFVSCKSDTQELVIYDPRSSGNAKFTMKSNYFPKDHWAEPTVKNSGFSGIIIIYRESSNGDFITEYVCNPESLLLSKKRIPQTMVQRGRYWRDKGAIYESN